MHRSRLSVLVIFAAAAACSTHDDSNGNAILSRDSSLVARLDVKEARQPLPDACGTVAVAAQPAAADKRQADEMTRQAYDAEILGKVQEAKTLLLRASELDGTNKSAAYHLGLTSEALGERSAAVKAYCRYLALTPTTAESAEARQRVDRLSQPAQRVAAANVSDSAATRRSAPAATARRATRHQPTQATTAPRVEASAPVAQAARPASPAQEVVGKSQGTAVATSSTVDSTAAGGDVVESPRPTPTTDEPSTAPRVPSRGPNRAQGAGIGAATGAIIGAVTGRSVKSAIIGAAAGGIFGGAMGRQIGPAGGTWR